MRYSVWLIGLVCVLQSSDCTYRMVSGAGDGFSGILRSHSLDNSVWNGAMKGRFDTPHTARWIQVDGQMKKVSWKLARTPFGFLEFPYGRLRCDAYFPGTAGHVVGHTATHLTEQQRAEFSAALSVATRESDVLRLRERGRGGKSDDSSTVTISPDAAQALYTSLNQSLVSKQSELANPLLVWQCMLWAEVSLANRRRHSHSGAGFTEYVHGARSRRGMIDFVRLYTICLIYLCVRRA